MSEPFLGEIRLFAGNFAPSGWAFCDGTLLSVSEYDALFSLIGTIYGGDGQTTFGLPDLRGRAPMHIASTVRLGATGGRETVTLTAAQLGGHTHRLMGSSHVATDTAAASRVLAQTGTFDGYQSEAATGAMAPAVDPVGGGQPHENMQPFQVVNVIISLFGIYPTQS